MDDSSSKPTAELIGIIKHLSMFSDGSNIDERDRIISRVDKQFSECDQRIDKYIRNSSKDLSRLIKVFNDIAKKIEHSRSSVLHSREALKQCKILLQSKRDDVRRLWLEWCEQKFYFENLDRLKKLYTSSENIRLMCLDKNFLGAAQLLSECSILIEQDYSDINGLHEIKRHLEDERLRLEKYLYQELTDQLYTNVTKSVLETGTVQPSRDASFKRNRYLVSSQDAANQLNKQNQQMIDSSPQSVIEKLVQAAAKLNNTENNMNIVEKMINELNKNIIKQLIQMINTTSIHVVESNLIGTGKYGANNIQNNPKFLCQLLDLTYEQFKTMAKHYKIFIDHASNINKNKYQSNLIWTCIQNVLIQLLEEYLDIRQFGSSSMTSSGVSNDIQTDKFDINSYFVRKRLINLTFGTNDPQPGGDQGQMSNNSDDGSQKYNYRMFTFKGSSQAMSITNYFREQNKEDLFVNNSDNESSEMTDMMNQININEQQQRLFKILVCQPGNRNITTIFSTMEHIVKEISDEIRLLPSINEPQQPNKADLLIIDKFLQDFILKTFITNAVESIKENARIHNQLIPTRSSDSDSQRVEIPKELISLSKQRELGLNKPILQNILHVYESCMDLFNLILDMNSYASEFSRAMYSLIEKHTDYCNKIFLSIVSTDTIAGPSGDNVGSFKYVYSMQWVQDEGIKKYFKQLPAFSSAIKNKPSPAAALLNLSAQQQQKQSNTLINTILNKTSSSAAVANLNSIHNPAVLKANVELEQFDIELLSKEVETLISNLNNDKELEEIDIITNFNYIEMIAHLHESCDWLITQLKYIIGSLEQMIKNPKSLNNSLSIGELNKLSKQLDDLDKWRGDTLLLLYLETRLHCFYHLLDFIKQENNILYSGDVDTDPDESVLNMNRDLHRIYEHLSRSLQEHKVNYVFDALGFMIATIFIKAIKNFKKISAHGIAKMCRNIFNVDQNLSAIRNKSDPHLMRAHRFYELLYKTPEELLTYLLEHECEFQLNDYINLLNLIHKSGNGINSLSDNIQSLKNILKNKQ